MIGDRIKERRLELGLTQEELAKKMGYKSKSTINKIELGINDVNQTKVMQFAKALDTSIAYLMEWDNEAPEFKPVADAILFTDDNRKLIIEMLQKMNGDSIHKMTEYARFVFGMQKEQENED